MTFFLSLCLANCLIVEFFFVAGSGFATAQHTFPPKQNFSGNGNGNVPYVTLVAVVGGLVLDPTLVGDLFAIANQLVS